MSTPSSSVREFPVGTQRIVPPTMSPVRPLFWSLRRELWENRSIYLAPLAVSAVLMFALLISMATTLPGRMRAAAADPSKLQAVSMPFDMAAGLPIVVGFIVGVFYCLDALYSERRERSILFWKSLPVSDRMTVLAKASIPLVVMPLIIFALVIVTQTVLMLFSRAVLAASGLSARPLLEHVMLFHRQLAFLYALIAIALWHAPIYGWLLLLSAWARRSAFLWAVLPPAAIAAFEHIALKNNHFALFLRYRGAGWLNLAFRNGGHPPGDPLTHLTPGNFLGTPGLWVGLAFAAACLAAAVRLRRNREPI